ncbi:MAG: amino acid permease [Elusimicrobia bacterium]|nr:amino acid permease [Elusimicrobiota bacterium]
MPLEKQINLTGVFCIATGAMISSGLFVLPAIAFSKAGPAMVLSYLIAGILIVPVMLSKAELLTAMPKAGGDYFYISRGAGALAGFLGGLSSWFSLAFKSAFALIGIGAFASIIFPGISEFQIDLIAGFFCLVFMFVNLKGVQIASKIQIFLVFFLIAILAFYIIAGFPEVRLRNFEGFFSKGWRNVFGTSGLVFISFAGLTKVAGIAEEVKNPVRNIPMGMFLSWFVVMILYCLAVFVTVGLLPASTLSATLVPLSAAAGNFAGSAGVIALAAAAMFAFVSTANAGIMTASRTPFAMSEDGFLPSGMRRINKKGVPYVTVFVTTFFMLAVIFLLSIEGLVKTASAIIIILFIFANISLILMREGKIPNYKPVFKSPLYPYIQILSSAVYVFLLFEMGKGALIATAAFFACGVAWFLAYPYKIESRKSALIHVVERIIGRQIQVDTLRDELRSVLKSRDEIVEDKFDELVKKSEIMDISHRMEMKEFFGKICEKFSAKLGIDAKILYEKFVKRENDSSTVLRPGLAVPHIVADVGEDFEMILVRARKGIIFPMSPPIKTLFVIVASTSKRNFYLRSLMAIAEIVQEKDFERKWLSAETTDDLRDIILLAARKRDLK